jgi:hypothetical protein
MSVRADHEAENEEARGLKPRHAFTLAMLAFSASCVPGPGAAGLNSASVTIQLPPAIPYDETGDAAAFAALDVDPSQAAPPADKGPAAKPHIFRARSSDDQARALDCLTEAVYYEAASETNDGQRAVAQVVLNRVRHPSYPNSVCGVVYQGPLRPGGGCQFTFTCDGSLRRRAGGSAWYSARRVASAALAGEVYAPVGNSTHYHTFAVRPVWSRMLSKTAVIGSHIFYRMTGAAGSPGIFRAAYTGREGVQAVAAKQSALMRSAMVPVQARPAVATYVGPSVRKHVGALPAGIAIHTMGVGDSATQGFAPELPKDYNVREEYRTSGSWKGEVQPAN